MAAGTVAVAVHLGRSPRRPRQTQRGDSDFDPTYPERLAKDKSNKPGAEDHKHSFQRPNKDGASHGTEAEHTPAKITTRSHRGRPAVTGYSSEKNGVISETRCQAIPFRRRAKSCAPSASRRGYSYFTGDPRLSSPCRRSAPPCTAAWRRGRRPLPRRTASGEQPRRQMRARRRRIREYRTDM